MKELCEPQQRLSIDAYDYVEVDEKAIREWDLQNRWNNLKQLEKQSGKMDIKASIRNTNNTKLA